MSFVIGNFNDTTKWQEIKVGTGLVQNRTSDSFQASVAAAGDRAGLQTPTKRHISELTDLRLRLDRKVALAGINLAYEELTDTDLLTGYGYTLLRDALYGVIVWYEGGGAYVLPDPILPSELEELRITAELTADGWLLTFYYNNQVLFQKIKARWSGEYFYVKIAASPERGTVFIAGTNTFASTGYVPPQHALTVQATTGGTTNPALGTYAYSVGANVTVTAIPSSGYKLDRWELDGVNIGSVNPTMVTMNADHTLLAVFAEIPIVPKHTLTVGSIPIEGVPFTIERVS